MPGVVEVKEQDPGVVAFAVSVRVRGVEEQVTVRPVGLTVIVRLTLPAKLFTLVKTKPADAPDAPTLKLTPLGATTWKSPTWIVTEAECEAVPGEPEPAMVTA